MRKFIPIPNKPRTLAQMREYLKSHPRRYGWIGGNDELGICHNVKLRSLSLTGKEYDACCEKLSDENIYYSSGVSYAMGEFSRLNPGYAVYQTGRSAGYFVLHNKGTFTSGPVWAEESSHSQDTRQDFRIVWAFDQWVNKAVSGFVEYCVYSPTWELAPND